MQVIPVIDLMGGHVVGAVRGDRSTYRPIQSALCSGSEPLVVARALLNCTGSNILYIADLDALTGGEPQVAIMAALLAALPSTSIWIDGGFRDAASSTVLLRALGADGERVSPVFGSESLASLEAARIALSDPAGAILSLDRCGDQILDEAGCWRDSSLWPERLIVMTLERVGAFNGPELDVLASIRTRAPRTMLVGAGGIRDAADLQAAATAGADAWLVASALHNRKLGPFR